MPDTDEGRARVTLALTMGSLDQSEFEFTGHDTCVIGRTEDCAIMIPPQDGRTTVSRFHCVIEVNTDAYPPQAGIRDFGSRNGTFVNDELIGARDREETPEEGRLRTYPVRNLRDGDRVRLAKAVEFLVRIYSEAPDATVEESIEAPVWSEYQEARQQVEAAVAVAETPKLPPAAKEPVPPPAPAPAPVQVAPPEKRDMTPQPPAEPAPPEMGVCAAALMRALPDFDIRGCIGWGGTAEVYLAHHRVNGQPYAIKALLPQVAVRERAREKFLREVRNWEALNHPNIVRLHRALHLEGLFIQVMDWCDGGDMLSLMNDKGGVLSVDEALNVILPALDGLEYAHQAQVPNPNPRRVGEMKTGVVHRDIKPSNIFLKSEGGRLVPKIGDFGLAKAFELAGYSGLTVTGWFQGTPRFSSRIQVLKFRHGGPEVDVWSTAASLYFALTGAAPREFPQGRDELDVILNDDPIPIRQRNASVPEPLAREIDLALRDRPDIPIKSAVEFKTRLLRAVGRR